MVTKHSFYYPSHIIAGVHISKTNRKKCEFHYTIIRGTKAERTTLDSHPLAGHNNTSTGDLCNSHSSLNGMNTHFLQKSPSHPVKNLNPPHIATPKIFIYTDVLLIPGDISGPATMSSSVNLGGENN